jgi:lipoprotein-anchoring transpeptidase ErfK/SrfK
LPHRSATVNAAVTAAGVLGLGLAFVVSGAGLAVPRAEAQGLFGDWDSPSKARKKAKRAREAALEAEAGAPKKSEKKSKASEAAARAARGPLVINVSLSRQRLTVYDANGPIAESPVSSGRVGYATPTGVFTVLEKRRRHFSNLYAGAPMPNMQRLTWSGVALHAGALPGYPASHGCIRLPHGFSQKLFGMTKSGTRVIVSRDPVVPVPFAHERLFAAFPPEADEVADGQGPAPTQVADASAVASGAGDAVSAVLGVTAAVAATVDDTASGLSARERFRERRRLEAARLSAEIRTFGYEKATKASVLAMAHEAAEAARAPLVAAKAEAERLADDLATLEKAQARGERELATLTAPPKEDKAEKPSKRQKAERKRKPKVVDTAAREARIAELTEELKELPAAIASARAAADTAAAAYKAVAETAKTAEEKRRAAADDLKQVNARLAEVLAKEQANTRMEARRHLPVSVFISRAKQRLYIRQGYDDILDVAVTFERPEEPVGTHVFTALDFAEGKTAMTWSAVSVPYDSSRRSSKKADKSGKAKKGEQPQAVNLSAQTPAAALERIAIPEDVREQIADVMKPGSSLVISDHTLSNETGKFTDLIAQIR